MKKLKLSGAKALTREQQRNINGGSGVERGCCNRIQYDDGYYYSACNGQSKEECQNLVNTQFTDSFGTATVKECFCSDGHGGGF
ncbi:MAG: hypothetical protein KDC67_05895 [Ignavibacteriae bacterium]|nr:hypothetical protein [Ignavibacteriota bacterium]